MNYINENRRRNLYSLHGKSFSYSILLYKGRYPLNLHWGRRCELFPDKKFVPESERGFMISSEEDDPSFFVEEQLCEYGSAGYGDFRQPAFSLRDGRGYPIPGPFFVTPELHTEKPALHGLPAARFAESENAETLLLHMDDAHSGLRITLRYTPLPDYDAVLRSTCFENHGDEPFTLDRAMSCSLDLPYDGQQLLYLHGSWARERHLYRTPINPGLFSFGSTRGISSHQFNPFLALLSPHTGEHSGEAWGAALVYSGNFTAEAERNHDDNLRINLGIHPETFRWTLAPGERFDTPEAVLVYSPEGINGLSDRYHRFIRERILPPRFRNTERPVLFNNWEATYFDFSESQLKELADTASDLGIELFVLDDGWFGERNSDTTSLGDWNVNRRKLPGGLAGLGEHIRSRGMEFGLWVEPEMISRESELFRRRPDWCIHIPGRQPPEGRSQLVLDLTRQEVRQHLIETFNGILDAAPITYVKWDMNRYLASVASPGLPKERQEEVYHRYVLGLYEVMEVITSAHPEVLFEGCSGGGGRLDMGILYYMPQYWTSDNTDALSRLKIQYGTSILYPPIVMGAHVSAVPNHQVGRSTPLSTRGNAALSGNLGYELDISSLSENERAEVRRQIDFYKEHRRLLQFGHFLRLLSPFEGAETAWMWVDGTQQEALIVWFSAYREANLTRRRLRLAGLDPQRTYMVQENGRRYRGGELMNRGLLLPAVEQDAASVRLLLRAE